jgi:hypothetical protein
MSTRSSPVVRPNAFAKASANDHSVRPLSREALGLYVTESFPQPANGAGSGNNSGLDLGITSGARRSVAPLQRVDQIRSVWNFELAEQLKPRQH